MLRFSFCPLSDRAVIRIGGADRVDFLQALVSNDVGCATGSAAVYAALLTPQGRFLHDMFITAADEMLYLDVDAPRREDFLRRLKLYKLRASVDLLDVSDRYRVVAIPDKADLAAICAIPGIVYEDPRSSALGYRAIIRRDAYDGILTAGGIPANDPSYHRRRILLAIPDAARDLTPDKSLLLENNIDQFNGIDWHKGCYIGQEVTARMRYRGLLKKRLLPVRIMDESPPPGTDLTAASGEVIAEMRGAVEEYGLALLRLDHLKSAMGQGIFWGAVRLQLSLTPEVIERLDLQPFLTKGD